MDNFFRKIKNFFKFNNFVLKILVGLIISGTLNLGMVTVAHSFVGPGIRYPGTGGGLFEVDENRNIGFGTDSASPSYQLEDTESSTNHGYIFTVASTTNPGLGLYNTSSNIRYIWSARNNGPLDLFRETSVNGKVFLRFLPYGQLIINPAEYGWPYQSQGSYLMVGGNVDADAYSGSGLNLTSIDPQNFIAGSSFAAGNYAINGGLAVGTSTVSSAPTNGLYIEGNMGVGTNNFAWPSGLYLDNDIIFDGNSSKIRVNSSGINDLMEFDSSIVRFFVPIYGKWNEDLILRTAGDDDSNNILIIPDSDTGNVGIGTTTPNYTLDVAGDINLSGTFYQNGSPFQTGYWDITDSDVYYNSGNVGIGTTTPSYPLEVVSSSTDQVAAKFDNPIIIGTPTQDTHATTKSYVDSVVEGGSGETVGYWSLNGDNIYPTNTGNVGIGTNSPTKSLVLKLNDASGSDEFKIVDSAGGHVFTVDSDGNVLFGAYPAVANFNNSTVSGINNVNINDTGQREGMTWTGTNFSLDVSDEARTNGSTDNLNLYGTSGNIVSWRPLKLKGTGSNLLVEGTGSSYISGNLGIGTNTPSSRLDVASGRISNVGTPVNDSDAVTKSYVDSSVISGDSDWAMTSGGDPTLSGDIYRTGNIGIGTSTSQSQKLYVAGSIKTENRGWFRGSSDGSRDISLSLGRTYSDESPLFNIYTDDATGDIFEITSGRYTPTYRFRGAGSDSVGIELNYHYLDGANIEIHDSENSRKIYLNSEGNSYFNGGNLGIGVSNPSALTHINYEGAWGSGVKPQLGIQGTRMGLGFYDDNAGSINTALITSENGAMYFGYSGYTSDDWGYDEKTNVMTILPSGNVGIGDTTPSYKLDVTGSGRFTQPVVVGTPTDDTHATTKSYVDSAISNTSGSYVDETGDTMSGLLRFGIGQVDETSGTDPTQGIRFSGDSDEFDLFMREPVSSSETNEIVLQLGDNPADSFVVETESPSGEATTTPIMRVNESSGVHIYKNATVDGSLIVDETIYHNSDTDTKIVFTDDDIEMYAGGTASSRLKIHEDGTQDYIRIGSASYDIDTRITANGISNAFFVDGSNGNIGIGINEPNVKLEINDDTSPVMQLSVNGGNQPNSGSIYMTENSYDIANWGTSTMYGTRLIYDGDTNIFHIQMMDNTFQREILSGSRTTGNVGIGDTTPSYKLDVSGTGRFTQPVVVGTPTDDTHATTKSYVDSAVTTGDGDWLDVLGGDTSNTGAVYHEGDIAIGTTTVPTGTNVFMSGSSGDIVIEL